MNTKAKNIKSNDQKKLIALALLGGLAWGGYTLYQTLENNFSRLPVMGGGHSAKITTTQQGLTHLAPVQISAGNQTDQTLVDAINAKNALKTLNGNAFEAPKTPKEIKVIKNEVIKKVEVKPDNETKEMTLMERFLASGPHNLLSLVDPLQQPKLGVTFPAKNMAIINGQLLNVGDILTGFTYDVPDLKSGEGSAPIKRTIKLTQLTTNAAVLSDTWNGWEQTLILRLNQINVPLSGSEKEIVDFYMRVIQ